MKISNLAKKLKSTRKSHGLSMTEFCEKLNEVSMPVHEKTAYKWESGDLVPDLKCMNAIATIYNTTISSFFENNEACQALDPYEIFFIDHLRENECFKKIIYLLNRNSRGGQLNGI